MDKLDKGKKDGLQAEAGEARQPGIRRREHGWEFTAQVPMGSRAWLVIYGKEGEETELPFPEESRQGDLLSIFVKGLREEIRYNYRIDKQVVLDSRARYLCHAPAFGEKPSQNLCCGWKNDKYVWEEGDFQPRAFSESVFYKVQVRSFTMHKSSKVRKRGTFQGLEQKLPYLKELGVTGILLMPAYEYRERVGVKKRGQQYGYEEDKEENVKVNCWGYTGDACYFAPKAAFAATANPVREFKHMVEAMHRQGLECLMEFYFDGSIAPSAMLDIVKFWKTEYHIDGFHLMGKGICQELFIKEPLLSRTKLMFHDVDGAAVLEGRRPVFKNSAEYNEGFLYCMRRVLKGDEQMLDELMFRSKRNPSCNGVINYMADQDGFTMGDMVSYEERHNQENGEDNQDGVEYNCTWNCGAEGPTRKQAIVSLRRKQLRNAFCLLLFSQGTPLIYQGDEWAGTQKGNNNAWCQDNEIGWLDWTGARKNEKLLAFVKEAIGFRRANQVFHMEEEPKGADYKALGYPDISYHGEQAWYVSRDSVNRHLGIMYCGDYAGQDREFVFVACNFHWMSHNIALPGILEEISWQIVMRTDEEEGFCEKKEKIKGKTIEIPPRTIIILTGKQDERACGSGNILRRLQGTSF